MRNQSNILYRLLLILVLCFLDDLAVAVEPVNLVDTCTRDNTVYLDCVGEPLTGYVKTTHVKGHSAVQYYVNGIKEGVYTSWYGEGALRCQASYSGGVPDGPSQCFYPNGQIRAEKAFKGGKQFGKSLYWYETGALKKQYEYLDGLQHGVCTEWFESGNRRSQGGYVHGVLEGKVTYWYESGVLRGELEYRNGEIMNGEYQSWHEDGTLRSIIKYESNLKNGEIYWWDKNGIESVGVYKYNIPTRGHIADWDSHGNRVFEYLNKQGKVVHRYWDTDGNISRYVELQGGVKHGWEIEYLVNGAAKSQRSYEEGMLSGLSTLWYENGQEIATYRFQNDELVDGQYQTFYPNGKSQAITSYRRGSKDGLLVWWDSRGAAHQSFYSRGNLVSGLSPPFEETWPLSAIK